MNPIAASLEADKVSQIAKAASDAIYELPPEVRNLTDTLGGLCYLVGDAMAQMLKGDLEAKRVLFLSVGDLILSAVNHKLEASGAQAPAWAAHTGDTPQ